MTGPALRLDGTVARGTFSAAITLEVGPGEVVALLGPNGAGKSTVLRTVAGLQALRRGSLDLGRVLDDAATTFVPPAARRVGTVFQDHRLFPHLSVLENIAFGPRAQGAGRHQAHDEAMGWAERVGVGALASRRAADLSGGQAQRVAIARALAARPQALVLDEPLAALDAQARGEVQRTLAEHLRAFTGPCVLVTHDLVDALVLADRIVVLQDGGVVQAGAAVELARRPATPYVARLLGLTLVDGTLLGGPVGSRAAVRPSAVRLTPLGGDGASAGADAGPRATWSGTVASGADPGLRATWSGTVASVTPWGEHVRVEVTGTGPGTDATRAFADVTGPGSAERGRLVDVRPSVVAEVAAADVGPGLRPGAAVRVHVEGPAVALFPAVSR